MPSAVLHDRGVVKVSGPDAASFLQNLLTGDVTGIAEEHAGFSALLSPQGKILFDGLVARVPDADGGGFLIDTSRSMAGDFVKRLMMYKLRAKVTIEDMSTILGIVAFWGAATASSEDGLAFPDPRWAGLGSRLITAREGIEALADATPEAYHAHRTGEGVPEAGQDYVANETFPHEACMDQLNGIDFRKGCYIGQEVVSRMEHRGSGGRTRVVPILYTEGFGANEGIPVTAGDRIIGTTGSQVRGRGFAILRLDRYEEALAAGESIMTGGLAFSLAKPGWARFRFPGERA
jgi:tRNA-modifying protein YgfZ